MISTKEFFKKWKQGIKDLTPRQQLKAKIIGIYGMIVGIIVGGSILMMNGQWGFIILFVFLIFMQVIELIGVKQQYKQISEMEDAMEMERVNNLLGGE